MKKTFYYKNYKVRTSERDYKYAVLCEYETGIYWIECTSDFKSATRKLARYKEDLAKRIEEAKRILADGKASEHDRNFYAESLPVWERALREYKMVELEAR